MQDHSASSLYYIGMTGSNKICCAGLYVLVEMTKLAIPLRHLDMFDAAVGRRLFLIWSLSLGVSLGAFAQDQSLVRQWNEQLLGAISRDLARPPVHARNLFHTSAAMYDAWAAYEPAPGFYLLGQTRGTYTCAFDGVVVSSIETERIAAQEEALSFAMYRLILHRFQNSPGFATTIGLLNAFMDDLGYDRTNTAVNYQAGAAAELGNYVAQEFIAFGFTDGSNEVGNYAHQYYSPSNPPIEVELPGNPGIGDPNLWQQISLSNAIDQSGNPVFGVPAPVGHEWGNVVPFALDENDVVERVRNGDTYRVFMDPGPPPLLDTNVITGLESLYKWSFTMVSIWQSHLDPSDTTMWDISPGASGNVQAYPNDEASFRAFYNFFDGGDPGQGRALNPITGEPYQPQLVKRGDYARILAEYWADGPQSVTPPGHWFDIMHRTMDHPLFERRWMGEGDVLSSLEYDAKAHFAMGGAMHDAAIAAWSIKGWYDYVRPVSAIRFMADRGQSSDPMLPNFHPAGLPLIPNHVEQVDDLDPLAGDQGEHIGKIKLYTWRGPDFIEDSETDVAGVGWILAENWWPYQRPWFVTPPFSGYISGHSTYSSTAAQAMEDMTGDPFFPGGMSNFAALQNEFLEFEIGPSEDVFLQWATYRDASDQCSLSRIWGGIHPPVDDIAGRVIGIELGDRAVAQANTIINAGLPRVQELLVSDPLINIQDIGATLTVDIVYDRDMDQSSVVDIAFIMDDPLLEALSFTSASWTDDRVHSLTFEVLNSSLRLEDIRLRIAGAIALDGLTQSVFLTADPFIVNTDRPFVASIASSTLLLNAALAQTGMFEADILFSEPCDVLSAVAITLTGTSDPAASIAYDPQTSTWVDEFQFKARFTVVDSDEEIAAVSLAVSGVLDAAGNAQEFHAPSVFVAIDTREPELADVLVSNSSLGLQALGNAALQITFEFDEDMNTGVTPSLSFPLDDPLASSLLAEPASSLWLDARRYRLSYTLLNGNEELFNIATMLEGFADTSGNDHGSNVLNDLFRIDTRRPVVQSVSPSELVVADLQVGPNGLTINVLFPEPMDQAQLALVQLSGPAELSNTFSADLAASEWVLPNTFRASFNVLDQNIELAGLGVNVSFARDLAGNSMLPFAAAALFDLDTRNPELLFLTANTYTITNTFTGAGGFSLLSVFSEPMEEAFAPAAVFSPNVDQVLQVDAAASAWLNTSTHVLVYTVANVDADVPAVDVALSSVRDRAGNLADIVTFAAFLSIDVQAVGIEERSATSAPRVYPNPSTSGGPLYVVVDPAMHGGSMEVFDALGGSVYNGRVLLLGQGATQVELPALAAGVYQLRVTVDGRGASSTFVVQ